jgi:hypothetical protein
MLIQARRLVPELRPDYLVVQYSDWLVDRSLSELSPSLFGAWPTPYFYDGEDGEFLLHPPIFPTRRPELSVEEFRDSPSGMVDRLRFFWQVGLPQFVWDDYHFQVYMLRRLLETIPNPTERWLELVRAVYAEFGDIADEYGARLIIVGLAYDHAPQALDPKVFPANAIIVYAHDALVDALPRPDQENYDKEYAHWRGDPPEIVDIHPNRAAHRIIANAILEGIGDVSRWRPE